MSSSHPIEAPTRRALLGGLLTLAIAPALSRPSPGLTPLETALEELRHAHLARWLDPDLSLPPPTPHPAARFSAAPC